LLELLQQRGTKTKIAKRIDAKTNARWLKVCDIKQPRTGLEVKFSYNYLAAMVLGGYDTSSEKTFVDSLSVEPKLRDAARLVRVIGDEDVSDTAAYVSVTWQDETVSDTSHDIANQPPLAETERRLRQKATSLLGQPAAEKIWSVVSSIDLGAKDVGRLLQEMEN
jgi:hypothetical protein